MQLIVSNTSMCNLFQGKSWIASRWLEYVKNFMPVIDYLLTYLNFECNVHNLNSRISERKKMIYWKQLLPDIPKKAAPHIIDQIHPRRKNQTVPICRSPTQKLTHKHETLPAGSCPLLAQQNTEKPAKIVPEKE